MVQWTFYYTMTSLKIPNLNLHFGEGLENS